MIALYNTTNPDICPTECQSKNNFFFAQIFFDLLLMNFQEAIFKIVKKTEAYR